MEAPSSAAEPAPVGVVVEEEAPKEKAEALYDTEEEETPPRADDDDDGPLRLFRTLMGASRPIKERPPATHFFMAPPPLGRCASSSVYADPVDHDGLRAWLENELAGPLRFNVSLTRELVETQRRSDYLLTENNVLRRRAEERAQVQQELGHCQQRALVASLSSVMQQQQLLLEQQQQLMGALRALAAGDNPPLRSTPI